MTAISFRNHDQRPQRLVHGLRGWESGGHVGSEFGDMRPGGTRVGIMTPFRERVRRGYRPRMIGSVQLTGLGAVRMNKSGWRDTMGDIRTKTFL